MKITVCIGSSCHLKGSRKIVEEFQSLIDKNALAGTVELAGSFCMGKCISGVSVMVDGEYHSLAPENAEDFFNGHVLNAAAAS